MRLSRRFRRLALLATTALIAAAPSVAHADPITTAVAAFVYSIGGAAAAAAVGNFLVAFGGIIYGTAGTWALSKLSGSKVASASQERQAQVTSLTLGEAPREAIVGRAGTGGSLADAYYYGGANGTDWNVFVTCVADHPCDALEGVWVNDKYEAFAGDGDVAGYNGQLRIWWRPGEAGDAPLPPEIAALGPATADGHLKGVARVVVAYKADAPDSKTPIWTAGRPQFLWVVRGARVYDPREDDTVIGGEGAQRWDDPSTWTWSENAELCRYAYSRGFYAFNDTSDPNRLRVGRGLTAYQAPPERIIAAANLCDELVEVSDGVSEPRYRVGGVLQANEAFGKVEQDFADAMGGYVIQPDGGVGVEPGQARTPVAFITDDDILVDRPISVTPFRSASDRVNTVIARYAEPSQKYADTAAGVQRDLADIAQDGQPLEETLSLSVLVTYRTQAERLADYRRKQHRYERVASFTLGPRFARLEEGDWIEWRSRRWNNEPKLFRITAYGLDQAWRNTLSLEETAVEVFGFGSTYTPADPHGPGLPPGTLALADVEAYAVSLEGEDQELVPAVQFNWTTPVDAAIEHIRAEIRPYGSSNIATTITAEVNSGSMFATNGVGASMTIQVRLVPLAGPGRAIAPSPWITLTTHALVSSDSRKLGDKAAAQWEAALSGAVAQVGEAVTASREAQLMVLQEAAEAAGRDFDLEKRISGSSGRPTGATLANTVRQVAEAKQSLVENYAEMLTGFANSAGALAIEAINRAAQDESLQLYQVSLAGVVDSNHTEATLAIGTLTTAQSSTATALLALSSSVSGNLSSITSSLTTLSTTQSSQATALFALQTTVGGHTASILTTQATVVDLSGHVAASYGVDITADGVAVGFRGISNGLTGGWKFYGPTFGIKTDTSVVKYPFFVSAETVYLANTVVDGDLLLTGSLRFTAAPAGEFSPATSFIDSTGVDLTTSYQTVCSYMVYCAAGDLDVVSALAVQNSASDDAGVTVGLFVDGALIDEWNVAFRRTFTSRDSQETTVPEPAVGWRTVALQVKAIESGSSLRKVQCRLAVKNRRR